MSDTLQRRFRESASRLPVPVQLSEDYARCAGQTELPLIAAGYVETVEVELSLLMIQLGAGPEGAK
jgi:hypothetical protein